MAQVIKEIQVEVSKPNFFQAIVAKQFDSKSRFLRATLVDNGEKITVPDGAAVTINARRSDGGEKRFTGSVDKGKGTVLVPLAAWMLQLEGTVKSDITVSSSGKILTTTSFVIEVERASCQDSGVSEDDANVDILTQLILDVQAIKPDTTYNPTSTNAQSGVAVAEAIAGVKVTTDKTVTEGSDNPVSGGAVKTYVDGQIGVLDITVDELTDILDKSTNLYNVNTNKVGTNINSSGVETSAPTMSATDYIYLTAGTYYVTGFYPKGTNTTQQFAYMVKYDVYKKIQGVRLNFNSGSFTMDYDGFVRFSGETIRMTQIVLSKDTAPTEYVPYKVEIKASHFPVDQTYDPTSQKALSGVAVAEALTQVKIDVDDTVEENSTNPVSGGAVKKYVDDATQGEASKINPQDINGTAVVGNLAPTMKLVGKGGAVLENGVIDLVEFKDWNTYSLKAEVGTYTVYAQNKQYKCVVVAGDKITAVGELYLGADKNLYEVGEEAEYLLISIPESNFDSLMVNIGENTSLSTKYVLPDAFNSYKDEFGQILPENIEGVKNVGDLICRAKLFKSDCWFSYSNSKISFNTDTTQDVYLLKIADVGNYTMTVPTYTKILFLDESFIPCSDFKSLNSGKVTIPSGDNASYIMFTMVKGFESDFHISFGDKVYIEPIYELPEWMGSSNVSSSVDYLTGIRKPCLIGDSLTVGHCATKVSEPTFKIITECSWGYQLFTKQYNTPIDIIGKSGATARTNLEEFADRFAQISQNDMFIIYLGTNTGSESTIGTVDDIVSSYDATPTSTFIGWYSKLLKTIDHYGSPYAIKIACGLARTSVDFTNKNSAIKLVCETIGGWLYCDTRSYSSLIHTLPNNDDNIHPTAITYAEYAEMFKRALNKTIIENPDSINKTALIEITD